MLIAASRRPRQRREYSGAVSGGDDTFRLGDNGRAGDHRNPGKAGRRDGLDSRRADHWQIDTLVLSELGGFNQNAAAMIGADAASATKFCDPRQRSVGALRPFDREDMIVRDDDCLADIERARRVEQRQAARDVDAVTLVRLAGTKRTLGHGEFWSDVSRTQQAEAMLLEHPPDAGLQMVVATAEELNDLRHQTECAEIRPDLAQGRARHRADERDVAAAFLLGDALESAELPHPGPVMRIGGDALRIGPTAERKQHDPPAAPYRGVGERERQGATTADYGKRRGIARSVCRSLAHRRWLR